MFFVSKLCFLCLNTYKNLNLVLIENSEEILIQKQLKYCLPEIIDSHSQIPKYVCSDCMMKLECFYNFKQTCLLNNTYLKSYFQTLISTGKSYKHLSVKLTDIQYQIKQQTEVTIGGDDELITEEKKDNGTSIQEAVIKHEIPNAEILDTVDSHSLYAKEKNFVVKEEFLLTQDKVDVEVYREYVKSIKCESISSHSDVAVSGVEDIIHENSKYSNSSSENISTNSEVNKITGEKKIKENANCQCLVCIKKFECSICKKKFRLKSTLTQHEYTHNGIKNFECSICKRKFAIKKNMIEHEYTHTGIKNFECLICKQKFTQKSTLIQHKNTHTGTKDFECLTCNKKFASKRNLIRHEKGHTGIKNYECLICKKKFMRKYNLIQHENFHTAIKNFECLTCKKKFASKKYLIQHEKSHTGIKNHI